MLRHFLQIKEQVLAPFSSYNQEGSMMFVDSLGGTGMTHSLADIQSASSE